MTERVGGVLYNLQRVERRAQAGTGGGYLAM